MKRDGIFLMIICFGVCVIWLQHANADPALDLWMTTDNYIVTTSPFEVYVQRTNTDFGLGSLSYNMQFSELLQLTREYSDYEWVTNDGLFDSTDPCDGFAGTFTSIRFDTVHSPAGSEFSPSSGDVETLTIEVFDWTPRWVYFDIVSPAATDGLGVDLVTGIGGSISVIPDDTPAPEQGHTLAVYIPEPATILLLSIGGLFTLKKRKK